MGNRRISADELIAIGNRLGDAVLDPAVWPEIMEQISAAAGAKGAALLQSDVRTQDIPRTAGVGESFDAYFAQGWHLRDVRAERGAPLLLRGERVVTDQDILSPDEMRRLDFYADYLPSQGLRWFAAIGFWSGSALWGLSLQRTGRDAPFGPYDKQALAVLSEALTETATLSKAVGRAVLTGVTNALGLIGRSALAIDRHAFVLDQNAQADALFDNEIFVSNRRLIIKEQKASSAYRRLINRLAVTPDAETLTTTPIVIGRTRKRPCVIHVLPVPVAARSPFLGARALLTFTDLELNCGPKPLVLSQAFGLTPADARLASLIGAGNSPEQAAQELGVSEATARNQLKAVFNKTNTHRQPELVALLSRLNLG